VKDERWRRVEALYHSALKLPAEQRVAFLESSCGEDTSLREEVASLIAREGAAMGFMEAPAFEVAAHEIAREKNQGETHVAAEEFVPGNLLARRYRIATLLGRGGMGAVYRADDLDLGQVVALKFLPRAYSQDARRLERFRAEVRNARQISHPSVCRVYDIHEADGLQFLTMEYIDGEDLSSLLRRIGHLPQNKALQIARQLCAGLAAAHERGVLHRDLKPANIMIDGHGHARITDFGLAVNFDDARELRETAGTPAYMAPEQLDGKPATVKSDLYSLGLVLYELYTGKQAFDVGSLGEWKKTVSQLDPLPLSARVENIDWKVERAILQCLEQDPQRRPSSALKIAAALPGGDLLAETVAAGETPSPEMVAAAEEPALRVGTAWAALVATLALLAGLALIANRSTVQGLVSVGKEQAVLTEEAKTIMRQAGYTGPFKDTDSEIGYYYPLVAYLTAKEPHNLAQALSRYPGPMFFWYRANARPFRPVAPGATVTYNQPPMEDGSVRVWLTCKGQLWSFRAISMPQERKSTLPIKQVDWSPVFAQAGLSMNAFHEVPAISVQPVPFDSRAEWEGTVEGTSFQVHAASLNGRMVAFEIIPQFAPSKLGRNLLFPLGFIDMLTLFAPALLIVIGSVYAYRNFRRRRGDRKGAIWVFLGIFFVSFFESVGQQHPPASFADALNITLIEGVGSSLFFGAIGWVAYLAVEPFTRRHRPHLLISWSRIVAGNYLNPTVGRDLLLGVLAGCGAALMVHILHLLAPLAAPLQNGYPFFSTATPLLALSRLATLLRLVLIQALGVMFFLVVLKRWLRSEAIAIILTALILGLAAPNIEIGVWWLIYSGTYIAALICVLVGSRLGLLGLTAAVFAETTFVFSFTAIRWSDWNVARPLLLLGFFAALAIYGFRIAVARPMLTTALDE
jgi:serine/threonine-protein kinase